MNIPVVTENMIKAAEAVDDLYRMGQPQLWARVFRAMYAAMPVSAEAQPVAGDGKIFDGEKWLDIAPSMETFAMLNMIKHYESASAQPSAPVAQAERHVLTPDLLADCIPDSAIIFDDEVPRRVSMTYAELKEFSEALLSTAPQVEAKEGWISVDERLPEENRNVLVCHRTDTDGVPDLSVTVGRAENDSWTVAATFYNLAGARDGRPFELRQTEADVAFWMPLPAAPSSQKEGEQHHD